MIGLLRYGAYPAILMACVTGNLVLFQLGTGVLAATYVPVTLGTLLIMAMERWLPYRSDWRPSRVEVVQDSTLLALVHVILPKALAVVSVFVMFDVLNGRGWIIASWWAHDWPVPVQTVLMVLIVDGTRYWLHRISHEWEPLWRFHAVHHAPQRLYTLNVGRFHPVDKGLQFGLDALPFLAVGVREDVLSLYFVGVRGERVLSAFQCGRATGMAELCGQWTGTASVAPFHAEGGVESQLRESFDCLGCCVPVPLPAS